MVLRSEYELLSTWAESANYLPLSLSFPMKTALPPCGLVCSML